MTGMQRRKTTEPTADARPPARNGSTTMTEPRILNYGRHLVEEDDIQAVCAVLRGDLITQGPMVERLEQALAERVGARYGVLVNSGTSALHIACLAAGMTPHSRGVTSALTFVASANAMVYCGGVPATVDIDPARLGMMPEALRRHLDVYPETRVVMPVSFGGLAHAAAEIRSIAGDRIVIEDASHTLGGCYDDGSPVGCGAYADMTVFSFHPVKPITMGEGGCLVTNDPELARRARLYRSHGIERSPDRFIGDHVEDGDILPWVYEQQALGFNYRITDIQAALGLSQLAKLDRFVARRRQIAAYYDEAFGSLPHLRIPQSAPEDRARSGHHLYVVSLDFEQLGITRRIFMERLKAHRVGTQVHYIPLYRQPFHARTFGMRIEDHPNAEEYYRRCLSIPLSPDLTDEEVERVVVAVRESMEP